MNEYIESLRNYIKTLERHLDELRGFAPSAVPVQTIQPEHTQSEGK